MRKLSTHFGRSALAGVLLSAASVLPMAALSPAAAENGNRDSEIEEMFSRFDVVPGKAWYRLAGERQHMAARASDDGKPVVPGPLVGEIEDRLGVLFCKYIKGGVVYSNLKPCGKLDAKTKTFTPSHPFMEIPLKGVVSAPTGNITHDYALYMPTEYGDLKTAKLVQAGMKTFRWPAPVVQAEAADKFVDAAKPATDKASEPVKNVPVPATLDGTRVTVGGETAVLKMGF